MQNLVGLIYDSCILLTVEEIRLFTTEITDSKFVFKLYSLKDKTNLQDNKK